MLATFARSNRWAQLALALMAGVGCCSCTLAAPLDDLNVADGGPAPAPAPDSPPECRSVVTAGSYLTTLEATGSRIEGHADCSYERGSTEVKRICAVSETTVGRAADPEAPNPFTFTQVTTWDTIDDAVEHGYPIGRDRSASLEFTFADDTTCPLLETNRHDKQGRLLQTLVTSTGDPAQCAAGTRSYTAWDEEGRPLEGTTTLGVPGSLCSKRRLQLAYDDTKRTVTLTSSGGTSTGATQACAESTTQLETYDADHMRISRETDGPSRSLRTDQILSTIELCR